MSKNSSSVGCCLHQSRERCFRLHACARSCRRRRDEGIGTAGKGADMSVLVVLVHGERDKLSVEAVLGGGVEGKVLGSVSQRCLKNLDVM